MGAGSGPLLQARGELHIGLVNNMPDGAFVATERQFTTLVKAANDGGPLRLHLAFLPEIRRGEAVAARLKARYIPLDALFERRLDGLIVTGCEPRTAELRDELYWPSFTRLVDWAQARTRSTLWSCLAAHAAVLHLHGIERRRLDRKLFGVFTRAEVSAAGYRHRMRLGSCVPHSRLNTLPQADLVRRGYEVLAELGGGEPDAFAMDVGSRFLFLQGHPEYEADTLRLEYERDFRRFEQGRLKAAPAPPDNYAGRADWRGSAVALYASWLDDLRSQTMLYSAA